MVTTEFLGSKNNSEKSKNLLCPTTLKSGGFSLPAGAHGPVASLESPVCAIPLDEEANYQELLDQAKAEPKEAEANLKSQPPPVVHAVRAPAPQQETQQDRKARRLRMELYIGIGLRVVILIVLIVGLLVRRTDNEPDTNG